MLRKTMPESAIPLEILRLIWHYSREGWTTVPRILSIRAAIGRGATTVGNRTLATGLIIAALLAGSGAWAQDAPRFESKDVLESLGLFANQRDDLDDEDSEKNNESELKVDFSFRGKPAEQESGFLYLQDGSSPEGTADSHPSVADSGFTPRLSALGGLDTALDASGRTRSLPSFTPRYAGSEISLQYTPSDASGLSGFGLGVSSHYLREAPNTTLRPQASFSGIDPLARESVNVGVFINYSGLRMGASVTRETGGLEAGYEGFDVGLGYEWSAFSTELSVGDYSVLDAESAPLGLDQDFTRLELGAAYAVSERLRVSGGMRLFDYGQRFGLVAEGRDRSGMLYLGTRLNF